MSDAPLYFFIAGEASGDFLGARAMHALKKKLDGNVRFAGIGGPRMEEEGIDLLFPQSDLAHVGLFEIIIHIPHLLRRIWQVVAEVRRLRPTAVITIDSPDFCFRVAKRLKGEGIPLIHYVAPSVWAWRPGRAKKVAGFLDHLLALLPFEPPYFTKEGLACAFVGHPLVEGGADKGKAQRFRDKYNLRSDVPLLAVLPGSRISEINKLMPVFQKTVELIFEKNPALHIVIPTVTAVKKLVREAVRDWKVPVVVTEGDEDKYDAFAAAKAALACSGTVSIELALAKLPAVIAYKVNALTGALARCLIKTKYVTLVNIMQDRAVMPEFLQQNCTPEKLAEAIQELLTNEASREAQISSLAAVAGWLGQGQFVPSEKAAEVILSK